MVPAPQHPAPRFALLFFLIPVFRSTLAKIFRALCFLHCSRALLVCPIINVLLLYRPTDTFAMIIPVFVEYLGQFLIDFSQIYRHSSMP